MFSKILAISVVLLSTALFSVCPLAAGIQSGSTVGAKCLQEQKPLPEYFVGHAKSFGFDWEEIESVAASDAFLDAKNQCLGAGFTRCEWKFDLNNFTEVRYHGLFISKLGIAATVTVIGYCG